MIGTFTTTTFDNRRDFEERRPSGLYTNHNRFTLVGMEWMWRMMTGELRDAAAGTLTDHLGSARILVGNGDAEFSYGDTRLAGGETAQVALDSSPTIERIAAIEDGPDAVELVMRGTFGEQDANFEWAERGVVSAQGVLIDRAVGDNGRKPLGAIWQVEARLRLVG